MIKLTREQIELDSATDCRRNWVLKVTATSMNDAEYEEWKEAKNAEEERASRSVWEHDEAQKLKNLQFVIAMRKAASGELEVREETKPVFIDTSVEIAGYVGDDGDDEEDVNVFVYHAAEPDDPYHGDLFANVASLQDMESLPVDEPVAVEGIDEAENFFPFYRTSSVELHFHNVADAERVWNVIKHDVKMLAYEMWKAKHLKVAEEVVY